MLQHLLYVFTAYITVICKCVIEQFSKNVTPVWEMHRTSVCSQSLRGSIVVYHCIVGEHALQNIKLEFGTDAIKRIERMKVVFLKSCCLVEWLI